MQQREASGGSAAVGELKNLLPLHVLPNRNRGSKSDDDTEWFVYQIYTRISGSIFAAVVHRAHACVVYIQ